MHHLKREKSNKKTSSSGEKTSTKKPEPANIESGDRRRKLFETYSE
jgi:hypothetical protein